MLDDLSDAEEAVRPAKQYVLLPFLRTKAHEIGRRVIATGYDAGKQVILERRAATKNGRPKEATSRGKATPALEQRKSVSSRPNKGKGFV